MCLLVISWWQCRNEELRSWQGHESSTIQLGHLNASLNLERDEIVFSNAISSLQHIHLFLSIWMASIYTSCDRCGLLDIDRQTECPAQWSDSMGLYPIFTIFKALSGILGYWRREDDSILFQQSPYTTANRPSRVLLDPCCFPKALPSCCKGYKWLEKSRYVGGLFSQTKIAIEKYRSFV